MHVKVGNKQMELLSIPQGQFLMGSDNHLFSEAPKHLVHFRTEYLLGQYPVTQAQWVAIMGENPSTFRHSTDCPVDNVNWEQANDFCTRLSNQSGFRIRLPSEAEWEYACRAGTNGEFFFGDWVRFRDDNEIPWDARR